MNDNEKDRIAAAINALRPDWPVNSIRTILDGPKLAHRTRRDAAVALTWVACESASKTPARVNEAGPWWQAANAETGAVAPRPPKRGEACGECGKREDQHNAWDEHDWLPLDHATRSRAGNHAELVRTELRRGRMA